MKIFEITALLMVLTALFSFINYQALRMPTTVGVMVIALAVSLGIVALGWIVLNFPKAYDTVGNARRKRALSVTITND
ncbi:hypothetical protein [Desulfuromonas sp. TF]|uniref:hypothetical protein n=1 Tax=Desulfuromonas sp. TF TaxID=1232410 RepID=UPI00040074BA|nr:hypothetical protein [Desulfuromonas sp. TF]